MYYFDWAATTPISRKSLEVYNNCSLEFFANPSSSHTEGRRAAGKLGECRNRTAELLRTEPENIFFTSGGTESNSTVLNSLLNSPSTGEIITTAIEHPAITEYRNFFVSKGWKFTCLNCPDGYLNCDKLKTALNPNVRLVSIMAVNNVTGTVQDLEKAVGTIRDYSKKSGHRIHIHCDAVQAGGKMNFYPSLLDLDSASFSAHKFCGPRGTGILYNRNRSVLPLSKAGGQENGLRGGTENLPAIASMVYALENELENVEEHTEYVNTLRNRIETSLAGNGFSMISPSCNSGKDYSPYIICLSADGIPSEVFLRVMSDKGFCLSATSACSSSSKAKAEGVLSAMNIPPQKRMSAIRISLSHLNTVKETDELIRTMIETKKELLHG